MEKTKTSRKVISVILSLAIVFSILSVGFVGGFTADAATTVTLSPVPTGDYKYGIWLSGATPNQSMEITSFAGDKTVGPGTYYYAVASSPKYWLGDGDLVIILEVDSSLNVTAKDGKYNTAWGTPQGVISTGGTTVQSKVSGGVVYFGWGSLTSGKVYRGAGVSDSTLAQWAVMNKNSTKKQLMSANSVAALTQALGAPARSVNITNPAPVTLSTGAVINQMSVNSQDYVAYYKDEIKPISEYQYDEYFLNDHYLQGVWDAMPAQYGWEQDQWTEPGKFTRLVYSAVNGKSYAISLGGQNPWVLNDYFERTPSAGWKYGYDEIQEVPYLWHRETGSFISYENLESLKARTDYINAEGLGGVIIWEMSGDDTKTYPMTSLLKTELKDKGKNVVGYFTNWSVYNDYHQKQTPTELPWDLMTHINYSFYQVGGTYEHELPAPAHSLNSMDRYADDYSEVNAGDATAKNMLQSAKACKLEYPDTKLLISVGGWTRGDGFYEMVKSNANIDIFVASVKTFLDKYPFFDGVDLDWEYPGNMRQPDFDDPADRGSMGGDVDFSQYVTLLQKLRTYLDTRGEGKNVLTACVPAAPGNIDRQDILSVANYCTFINVMTYDYHGAFDPVGEIKNADGSGTGEYYELGYNAPLYGRTTDYNDWSTANTVSFLKSKGIPASKMNIGTPYYSRGWSGIPESTVTDKNGVAQPIPAGIIDPTPFDYQIGTTEVTGVTVSPTSASIKVGETQQLTATVTPSDATNKSVTWTSSNTSIATVSASGLVTGVAVGTATITVTTANGKTATSVITVTKEDIGDEYTDVTLKLLSTQAIINEKVVTIKDVLGNELITEMYPRGEGGRTMVPLRFVAEAYGSEVDWNQPNQLVKIKQPDVTMIFKIGSRSFQKYNTSTGALIGTFKMPNDSQPPILIGGRTYVPIRVISEELGYSVEYYQFKDSVTKEYVAYVTITNKPAAGKTYHDALFAAGKATI